MAPDAAQKLTAPGILWLHTEIFKMTHSVTVGHQPVVSTFKLKSANGNTLDYGYNRTVLNEVCISRWSAKFVELSAFFTVLPLFYSPLVFARTFQIFLLPTNHIK